MRRTIPLLLSLLLLVCAQSAGLLHGIGHATTRISAAPAFGAPLAGAVAPSQAALPAGPHSQDSRCDKCFQFAHFTGNAGLQPLLLLFVETVDALSIGPLAALVARDAPATRSRGPPSPL